MKAVLLADNSTWRRSQALRALRDGLESLGFTVNVLLPDEDPSRILARATDARLLAVWNGRKGQSARVLQSLRKSQPSVRTLILERGFFRRMHYTQVDGLGFNHTASWARHLQGPASLNGPARFFKAWKRRPAAQRSRQHGYVLILCQLQGDAQVQDCCVHHPQALCDLITDALPRNMPVGIRPHPLSSWRPKKQLLQGSLKQALSGARFCVTLNSNAANEAIATGCPVLAFGPALCSMAGAAHPATLPSLSNDLEDMLEGWSPPQQRAEQFLYHLADRQFSPAQLREGSVLKRILESQSWKQEQSPPS
jgi:hypothetical protein